MVVDRRSPRGKTTPKPRIKSCATRANVLTASTDEYFGGGRLQARVGGFYPCLRASTAPSAAGSRSAAPAFIPPCSDYFQRSCDCYSLSVITGGVPRNIDHVLRTQIRCGRSYRDKLCLGPFCRSGRADRLQPRARNPGWPEL